MIAALALALFAASPSANENPACLPDRVDFRSHTQSFSYEFYYALCDGRIWVKPNESTLSGRPAGSWKLFGGTGAPAGVRVAEIDQEGTMLVARSEKGRIYLWQPTLKPDTTWQENIGSPFTGAVTIPAGRAWAFSFSVGRGWLARDVEPMHDIVEYYEDARGYKIRHGITATIYALDPSGTRIRYWDTGLPNSFHRAFLTPERGRFVADALAASASTLFVTDTTGRMFTRMFDYEMSSGIVGLQWTYDRPPNPDPDAIGDLKTSLRTLPMPDWMEHKPIAVSGAAVVTRRIAIVLTGQGSRARELRVRGRNAEGVFGYWFKPLYGDAWGFRATGEPFPEADVITRYGGAPLRGPVLEKTYSGKLSMSGEPDLDLELVGFHYYDTPAKLRAHVGDETFELTLQTSDAYVATEQLTRAPELIGNVNGEPKLLSGTLLVPDEVRNSPSPAVRRAFETYFKRFDHVNFIFEIDADDSTVRLRTSRFMRKSRRYLDYAHYKPIRATLLNPAFLSPEELLTGYTFLATEPALIVDDPELLGPEDLPRLRKVIQANRLLLKGFAKLRRLDRRDDLKAGAINASFAVLWNAIALPIINLLGLPSWYEPSVGLMMQGGRVFSRYARLDLARAFSDRGDYQRSVELVKRRIELYEAQLPRLEGRPE